MRTSSTGKRGFTIVEVIVVIIMIGVLATMIAPRLAAGGRAAGLRLAGRQLQATAQYARDYAVSRRRVCRLVLDRDGDRYMLVAQSGPQHDPGAFEEVKTVVGRSCQLGKQVQFGEIHIDHRLRHEGDPVAEDTISFDPFGRSDAAAVQVTDGRYAYTVLIAPNTARVLLAEGPRTDLLEDREDLDG